MDDRQSQEFFATPPSSNDPPVYSLTDGFGAEMQRDLPGQEQEEEWKQRLCTLQEWICHLLIKNQQLRMSLDSAVSGRSRETNQEGS